MELEALYEGLCRREPDLFEPEALQNSWMPSHQPSAAKPWKPFCSCVRTGRSTPLRWGLRLPSGCSSDKSPLVALRGVD